MRSLGILVGVSALLSFSVTVFATSSAPSGPNPQLLANRGGAAQRTLKLSRRFLIDTSVPSSLGTASNTLSLREGIPALSTVNPVKQVIQPPAIKEIREASSSSVIAESLAPTSLYSSVDSVPRHPVSAAQQDAGKGGNAGIEYYHIFRNVRVQWIGTGELGVLFSYPVNEPPPEDKRVTRVWFTPEGPEHLSIPVEYRGVEASDSASIRCQDNWVNKPAMIFHAPYVDDMFHMANDAVLSVFQTLRDLKLLPRHIARLISSGSEQAADSEQCLLSGATEEVALISMRSAVFVQPWSFVLGHVSTDQSVFSAANGLCFDKLVIGTSEITDMYIDRPDNRENFKRARTQALRDFQTFALRSALTEKLEQLHSSAPKVELSRKLCQTLPSSRASQNSTESSATKWASGGDLPLVTLATRSLPASRALLNEAQIMAYIEARWEVKTVTTQFDGPLFDSIELVRHTDVLLGMHGAGWTNALFLSKGAVAVQLLPFGWDVSEGHRYGQISLEKLYKRIVVGLNAAYFSWVNQSPADTFFRREDFSIEDTESYVLHPKSSLAVDAPKDEVPKAHWIHQNTVADLRSLIPTLQAAFTLAGIPERDSWEATSARLLTQLEAETDAVRLEYMALQQQLPPAPQPELASSFSESASTS